MGVIIKTLRVGESSPEQPLVQPHILVRRAVAALNPRLPDDVTVSPYFDEVSESGERLDTYTAASLTRGPGVWAGGGTLSYLDLLDQQVCGLTLQVYRDAVSESDWGLMVSLAQAMVKEAHPSFGFIGRLQLNGPDDVKVTPWPEDLRLGALPLLFPRWTWIGPEALNDERRQLLAALPAVRTGPLGDGWEVLAVDKFMRSPSSAFVKALPTLPSFDPARPIGYLR